MDVLSARHSRLDVRDGIAGERADIGRPDFKIRYRFRHQRGDGRRYAAFWIVRITGDPTIDAMQKGAIVAWQADKAMLNFF